MGQKINPHGVRVGVIKNWDTRWYTDKKNIAEYLQEDYQLREFLMKKLSAASVSRIEIERAANRVTVNIHTARPGIVIGRAGAGIEALKKEVEAFLKKPASLNVMEIRNPDADAKLVAENIASQLARRISFRRAMKMTMQRSMKAAGVKGIKTQVSGRLGGAEIARREGYHEGSIPLQTLRADIDYGFAEAHTTYGRIGVKVWIYKGQIMPKPKKPAPVRQAQAVEGGE